MRYIYYLLIILIYIPTTTIAQKDKDTSSSKVYCLTDLLNEHKQEIKALKNKHKKDKELLNQKIDNLEEDKQSLSDKVSELKEKESRVSVQNKEYRQISGMLSKQMISSIDLIIKLRTDEISLELVKEINDISDVFLYIESALGGGTDRLVQKSELLSAYIKEYKIISSAKNNLYTKYNKNEIDISIKKLNELQIDGNRNQEKKEILNLLSNYCEMNNYMAKIFSDVDMISNKHKKNEQLYKPGLYQKKINKYPFLFQELEKKRKEISYNARLKEVECN